VKLLIVLVTHNRLELTKRTLESLLATVTVPHHIVVVDNASTDGTQDWLFEQAGENKIDWVIPNNDNAYPGAAANQGWAWGVSKYPGTTHLMRTDNDMEFRPGWDKEAVKAFKAFENLGQLGLMNQEQEFAPEPNRVTPLSHNGYTLNTYWFSIGGTHIMPKTLWDNGIRYDESPWRHMGVPTGQEDVKLSVTIKNQGFIVANLIPNLVWHLGDKAYYDQYPDYYRAKMEQRGYDYDAWLQGQIKGIDR